MKSNAELLQNFRSNTSTKERVFVLMISTVLSSDLGHLQRQHFFKYLTDMMMFDYSALIALMMSDLVSSGFDGIFGKILQQ